MPEPALAGPFGQWPRILNCHGPPCIGFGKPLDCSLTVSAILSCPQTRSLLRKSETSLDSTSIHRTKRWLCVDEKSEIQALDRTQPRLPMVLGYLEGVTHDYVRNGTTMLFAALDIANGQVLTACKKRHRHQEYLQFLKQVDASVPPDMATHLVVDNYATHKHPEVKR